MVQFWIKFDAATNAKTVQKSADFHNAKLRFFWAKNTISCGGFGLLTKPVVPAQFSGTTQL
jgi:hypothetical protein